MAGEVVVGEHPGGPGGERVEFAFGPRDLFARRLILVYQRVPLSQREQGLDEGFKLLRQAVDLDPTYYPVVDSLGWAYYQYGDFENALKFVAQANELSLAANAEVLDHLGDIEVNRLQDLHKELA